jgi:hypothetical protein
MGVVVLVSVDCRAASRVKAAKDETERWSARARRDSSSRSAGGRQMQRRTTWFLGFIVQDEFLGYWMFVMVFWLTATAPAPALPPRRPRATAAGFLGFMAHQWR